jgi:glyoxylase-like metal-dependent hydrolase (beta-lactamase superfamily II)
MIADPFPTRRVLIHDMGKAGLAVVVFGLAACATEGRPGGSTIAGSAGATTSTGGAPTSSSPPTSPTGTQPVAGHQWARASLGFVSAYILYRGGEAAVVDTGIPGSEGTIESALVGAGLSWDAVGHVVITHKHNDHQGSLEAVLAAAPEAGWYTGAGDLAQVVASRPGTAVGDGDSVFGLDIIETPGHTPGHLSVLDPVSGILVTGDAASGAGGTLAGPNPQFSEDMGQANDSIRKLAGFEYETILVGHGEPIISGGSEAMAALAATLD